MRKILVTILAVILLSITAIGACLAAVPDTMSYQGRLTKSSGEPAPDGVYGMVFTIYDAASVGTSLWTETQPNVQVTGGLFSVLLGSVVPLSESAFQGTTWLQTEVNGTTLTPRVQIVSTGYAIHAKTADTVPDNAITSAKLADDSASLSKVSGGAMISSGGNVGIGASTAGFPLTFSDALGDKISLFGQNPGPNYGFGLQDYLLQIHSGGVDADIAFGYGSSENFTETMRIKGNGKVGIGTTSPQQALSIVGGMNIDQANANNGTLSPAITFGDTSGEGIASKRTLGENNAGLDFYTNYVSRMSITNGGLVGIGAGDPQTPLDVNGIIRSRSGGIRFPDGTTQTTAASGGSSGWSLGGNAGTTSGTNFIGTTDNQALELKVNGTRALRIEPVTWSGNSAPNIIGGSPVNYMGPDVYAGTVSGGGYTGFQNRVTGGGGAVGGGANNQAADFGVVAGGLGNTAADWATVGGGSANTASGYGAVIPGGVWNVAAGQFSFAAGMYANANHQGTFVWADRSSDLGVSSTGDNQFLIRAAGGVGIGAGDPQTPLDVNGVIRSRAGGFKFPDGTVQATAAGVAGDGSVTTAKLADGAVTNAKVSDVAWNKLTGVPAGLADGDNDTTYSNGAGLSLNGNTFSLNSAYTDGLYWKLGGNAGTNPASNFIGTTDAQPLELRANNEPALRLRPDIVALNNTVGTSVIAGSRDNVILDGVVSGTIAGGGFRSQFGSYANVVRDNYGTVGGGMSNQAGDDLLNPASSSYATVGGGGNNIANGFGSTVSGGNSNTASGRDATVPGGVSNAALGDYSLAAGRRAKANHSGSFVWGDLTDADFASTAANQFLIRAWGGVGIGTDSPQQALSINGGMNVDQANANDGTLASGLTFGSFSGEGIASNRTLEGNNAGLDFYTNYANRMSITNGGLVGIGAADPQTALDVNGIIRSRSGGIRFPDGTTQTTAASGGAAGWSLGGNAGTTPSANFIGTTDNQPLEFRVNNTRGFRLEPTTSTPNVIGGSSGNRVTAGVIGATISGGGAASGIISVTGNYGTVGGGTENTGGNYGTVGGGIYNTASGIYSTVGGGYGNTASNPYVTVGATVGGGSDNTASGPGATVPGGYANSALGSYGFAAGCRAKANHHGAFVWADNSNFVDFASTANDQFLIRASGGVGIGTNSPQEALSIVGGMNIDQANNNNGVLNSGIRFGSESGEGIASRRQEGDNRWGLDFYTGHNRSMCITNSGKVGIGWTNPGYTLHVNGSVAGAGAYNQISDLRYKTNISTIGDALDKVEKLHGVNFDWKRDEHPELNFDEGRQIGLIAQEVEKIVPEAVSKDKDGNYSVAYSSLVPLLIEAVKEQQITIDELKVKNSQIDEIKAELAALKAQFAKN